MELRELGDRLFRLHAKLIIAAVLVGVVGALALHLGDRPQYQASARLVLGAQDPQSVTSAAVLADTARGIATGPQLVNRAISETGVSRAEANVAGTVNVQTLGSSGVLSLSVTDQDPQVAVRLANALAVGVVNTRAAIDQGGLATSLQALAQQEASAAAQIQNLNGRIGALAARIAASSPQGSGQSAAIAQLALLQSRRTSLQEAATQIAVKRNELMAQEGPKTAVIDKAVSAPGVPGRTLIDVILGGLLGLVVGIAIAAIREATRPSLVGAAAISRAIGAPLLGEMSTPPDSWTVATLRDAGANVELAACAQHVQDVRFAALAPQGRGRARVRMLEGPLQRLEFGQSGAGNPSVAAANGPRAGGVLLTAAASRIEAPPEHASPRTGLVVAVPRVLKRADADELSNFIWISGWTLLGVMVYPPSRNATSAAEGGPGSARSPHDSSHGGHVGADA